MFLVFSWHVGYWDVCLRKSTGLVHHLGCTILLRSCVRDCCNSYRRHSRLVCTITFVCLCFKEVSLALLLLLSAIRLLWLQTPVLYSSSLKNELQCYFRSFGPTDWAMRSQLQNQYTSERRISSVAKQFRSMRYFQYDTISQKSH